MICYTDAVNSTCNAMVYVGILVSTPGFLELWSIITIARFCSRHWPGSLPFRGGCNIDKPFHCARSAVIRVVHWLQVSKSGTRFRTEPTVYECVQSSDSFHNNRKSSSIDVEFYSTTVVISWCRSSARHNKAGQLRLELLMWQQQAAQRCP